MGYTNRVFIPIERLMRKHIARLKAHYQRIKKINHLKTIDAKIVSVLHGAEIGLIVAGLLILSSTFAFNILNFSAQSHPDTTNTSETTGL